MQRFGARVLLVVIAVVVAAGCNVSFLPMGGGAGSGAACLPGTWTYQTVQFQSPLSTPFGSLSITQSGPGTTLTFTDNTWTLATNTTFTATLTSPIGTLDGQITLDGSASGTYTVAGSNITFTLAALSGSATYEVQAGGQHLSGTLSLPSSGGLQKLVGLSGTAPFSCSATGLTFTLKPLTVHAKK